MAALMVTANKYTNTDSAMKIQVALDEAGMAKPVPPPKPAGESSRQQHHQNNKRKAEKTAQRHDNRLVAAAEPAADPEVKRWQTSKMVWQPAMSFEHMLDAPASTIVVQDPRTRFGSAPSPSAS